MAALLTAALLQDLLEDRPELLVIWTRPGSRAAADPAARHTARAQEPGCRDAGSPESIRIGGLKMIRIGGLALAYRSLVPDNKNPFTAPRNKEASSRHCKQHHALNTPRTLDHKQKLSG